MVNDPLEDPPSWDPRDGFQRRVSLSAALERALIVDIGCGNGRFLGRIKADFEDHRGVEVIEACAAFARARWGLKVEPRYPDLPGPPSLITFWHSLEHIPSEEIRGLLAQMRVGASPRTRIVVSVPNARSFQVLIFGSHWTYLDIPSHLHQFSPASLERLLFDNGFSIDDRFFSGIYIFTGYLLSFLNLITPGHNYFYRRKKRKEPSPYGAVLTLGLDYFCYFAAILGAAPAAALSILELLFPSRRSVLTWSFRPRPKLL